jgi:hypothetical protein
MPHHKPRQCAGPVHRKGTVFAFTNCEAKRAHTKPGKSHPVPVPVLYLRNALNVHLKGNKAR